VKVVCLGAHILDILGRPVPDIPPGQGRRVLDELVGDPLPRIC